MHYEKLPDGSVKCIEDEIPFDLPDGWVWGRLTTLLDIFITGPFGSSLHKSDYVENGIPLINPMNIVDGEIIPIDKMQISNETVERLASFKVIPNDIVIARRGDMGRCAVVHYTQTGWLCGTGSFVLRLSTFLWPEYFAACIRSPYAVTYLSGNSIGNTMLNLNQAILKNLLLPVPPFKEQKRIIDGINNADAYLKQLSDEREHLIATVAKTKSKILDLAIRGQLVPQNPSDEPASVLLDRIRIEKEELIRQGKLKRDKKESVIFRGDGNSYYEKVGDQRVCIDDDLPYSLPEGWVWCELQDCCIKEIKRGRSPKYADNGHVLSFAQKCNQKTGGINMGLALLIDDSTACRYEDDEYLQDGDIVINSTGTGTLGRVGIYRATDNLAGTPVVPDSHVTVVRVSSLLDPLYFFYCLKSMQSRLETLGEGSTNQKELKPLTVQQLRIPIPPIAEQNEIVKQIVALFGHLDAIATDLT